MAKGAQAQEVERLPGGVLNPVIDVRLDKLPVLGLLAAGRALKGGMKYEKHRPDNWRQIPAAEHYNHALAHMLKYQSGDRTEDHVGHTVSRILMWAELELGAKA